MANGSLTRGDFFQQKKLKTVEDGSCRECRLAAGRSSEEAVRDILGRIFLERRLGTEGGRGRENRER